MGFPKTKVEFKNMSIFIAFLDISIKIYVMTKEMIKNTILVI